MGDIQKLEWDSTHDEIEISNLLNVEKGLGIKFPEDFVKCAIKNHGGYPDLDTFDFENHEGAVFNRLLSFNEQKKTFILNVFQAIKDRLLDGIYPFASDPFGNYLCFDYRKGKDKSPIVVYWDHEEAFENPDTAIHVVCDTFSELLSKLYKSEE